MAGNSRYSRNPSRGNEMLKKLLFVSIFGLLFIGLSDYGYGCHKLDEQDPPQPIPHGKNGVPCGDPEPPPDDGGNKGTPVIVTFDDLEEDSIQSDDADTSAPYVDGEGLSAVIPDESPLGFFMNLKLGGPRNLFIDFGAAVDCADGNPPSDDSFGDCVRDARFDTAPLEGIVDCPFPSGLGVRARQDDGTPGGTPDETVCSAFVKAALAERTAFDLDGNGVMQNIEYILDMYPGDPGPAGGGPVKLVRSVTMDEWDINFKVPRPNGNKVTIWYFTFSNLPSGHCDPEMEPQFLSIRALNLSSDRNVGGARGADTWEIGTFDGDGYDDSRLACLSKAKGGNPDEFVGFFEMSFMYTVVIPEPAP